MNDNRSGRCPQKQFAECACFGSVVSTSLSNATGASAPWRFFVSSALLGVDVTIHAPDVPHPAEQSKRGHG